MSAAAVVFNTADMVFEIILAAAKLIFTDLLTDIKSIQIIYADHQNSTLVCNINYNTLKKRFDKAAAAVTSILSINKTSVEVRRKIAAGNYILRDTSDYIFDLIFESRVESFSFITKDAFLIFEGGFSTLLRAAIYPIFVRCTTIKYYIFRSTICSGVMINKIDNPDKIYDIVYNKQQILHKDNMNNDALIKEIGKVIAARIVNAAKIHPDKFSSLSGAASNWVMPADFEEFWLKFGRN